MNSNQLKKMFLVFCMVYFGSIFHNSSNAQVKIGVFADCQYCDCDTKGKRFYRNSLAKLNDCVEAFNNEDLDFVVGLGDLIDKDFASFEKVNSILNTSKTKVYQIMGNHDLSVEPEHINNVASALNLEENYYTISKKDWKFIFLNGNEVSLLSTNPARVAEAKQILDELTANKQPNNKNWNGGLGTAQISWLEAQLKTVKSENKNVAIFCHYPLLPIEAHTLWDSKKVLSIIEKYKNVKVWINGHNHAGNYVKKNGIHFITMHGMVDTEKENAFSLISFEKESIHVQGKGREISRTLSITK